jgi:hypothetical protein
MTGSEGAVEHSLVDVLPGRLANTPDASTDMWRAHAKMLCESLEHHIKEEESMVFEEVGEHFSEAERTAMGEAFLRQRERVMRKEEARRRPASPGARRDRRARPFAARVTRLGRRRTARGARCADQARQVARRAIALGWRRASSRVAPPWPR